MHHGVEVVAVLGVAVVAVVAAGVVLATTTCLGAGVEENEGVGDAVEAAGKSVGVAGADDSVMRLGERFAFKLNPIEPSLFIVIPENTAL